MIINIHIDFVLGEIITLLLKRYKYTAQSYSFLGEKQNYLPICFWSNSSLLFIDKALL